MGAQIVRSSASTVRLVHDGEMMRNAWPFCASAAFDKCSARFVGRILPCGASLVAGQELEFNTSKVHGQYIIEVVRPHEAGC